MAYFRKKSAVPKARKAKRYTRRTTGVKGLVAKMVKVELHKSIENKLVSLAFPLTNFNNPASSSADVIQIIPRIPQGSGDGARVGNQITMRNLSVKGHINVIPSGNDVARSRVMVRMLIVAPKQFPTNDIAVANTGSWLPFILKIGNGSAPLDGTIQSMYLPVNREMVTCLLDKKIYLNSDFFINSGAENYSARYTTKFFGVNLKVKNKVLRFDDSNQLPLNYSPSLLLSYCFLDGSAPSSISTALSMSFISVLDYEDA